MATYRITVNGERREVSVDPSAPLLWVLREELKLTGTKIAAMALCGACTAHLADEATCSCVLPISEVGERGVVTIEAIGSDRVGRAPRPSDVDIEGTMTNLCRCATYVRIRAAIKNGSRRLI